MAGIQPADYNGAVPVDGYGPGFFRVGGEVYRGPVLVEADGVHAWGGLEDLDTLLLLGGKVDVLFLGMGAENVPPPKALVAALESREVMVEPMSTPSAARSYNVTLSEGRRVASALLPL